jgi:hypothetical protein
MADQPPEPVESPETPQPDESPDAAQPEELATWSPPRGKLAKTVAWVILGALAACILGVVLVAVMRGHQ